MPQNIRVLVIDDEPNWTDSILKSLPPGFAVTAVSSTSDALAELKAHPDWDVVVVDLMLGSGSRHPSQHPDEAMRLLESLRSGRHRRPSVVVYSSYLADQREELLSLGADEFVLKSPASPRSADTQSFADVIRRAASRHRPVEDAEAAQTARLADIRRVIIEEIDRYAPIRERTISVPGEGSFELIKPLVGFKRDIEERLSRFVYSENVFLMMKFRAANMDLSDFIIESLSSHGLRGVRADQDEWNITRNVYNPVAVLYCCKYGIALFDEPEEHQAFSPNVAYELGMMHYQNKECLILKHASLRQVPFDLLKDLHMEYDKDLQVRRMITSWIKQIAPR